MNSYCFGKNNSKKCFRCIFKSEKINNKNKSIIVSLLSAILNSNLGLSYINFLEDADKILFVSKSQMKESLNACMQTD
jgi:hypothetical protein